MNKNHKLILQIITWVFVSFLLIFVLTLFYADLSLTSIGKDFVAYWASGRLLIEGHNPYHPDLIYTLQKSVGWVGEEPLVMYNPPWTLAFILPFSLENYILGKFLWLLFHLFVLIFCSEWLWRIYGGTQDNRWMNLLILCSFAPVYFMLTKGQIVPIILLGIVGFLHFEKNKQWTLAGSFAGMMSIKPHLAFLFYVALFLWVLQRRRWEVLFGAVTVFLSMTAIPIIFNPDILFQYYDEIASKSFQFQWATPSFGTLLRLVLGNEKYYLQFLPAIIGISWLLFHWHHTRKNWVWAEQMPILLFASLMTTFYVWVNDFALLIVAIMQAGIWIVHSPRHIFFNYSVIIYIIINIFAWFTCFAARSEQMIVWMVPALFVNYMLTRTYVYKAYKSS